jgi:hypothetical protein
MLASVHNSPYSYGHPWISFSNKRLWDSTIVDAFCSEMPEDVHGRSCTLALLAGNSRKIRQRVNRKNNATDMGTRRDVMLAWRDKNLHALSVAWPSRYRYRDCYHYRHPNYYHYLYRYRFDYRYKLPIGLLQR